MGNLSPTPVNPSFIAKIEGLRPNYSIQPNRSTENKHGFFLPPDRRAAYYKEDAVYVRWHVGRMSTLQNGSIETASLGRVHSAATIFSQTDDTDHLLAVDFNASLTDVASYGPGWRVLSFDHIPKPNTNATYSSINIFGEEKHLAAGGSPTWMGQLMPHEYKYQRTTPNGHPIPSTTTSAGLIGSLPILVGLAAFSAPKDSLIAVLRSSVVPKAWKKHHLPTGRKPRSLIPSSLTDSLRHSRAWDGSDNLLRPDKSPLFYQGHTRSARERRLWPFLRLTRATTPRSTASSASCSSLLSSSSTECYGQNARLFTVNRSLDRGYTAGSSTTWRNDCLLPLYSIRLPRSIGLFLSPAFPGTFCLHVGARLLIQSSCIQFGVHTGLGPLVHITTWVEALYNAI